MSQMDTSAAIADSIQTQYASMIDSLLLACERLEAEKAALARERDEALAARDRAIAAYKGRVLFSRLGVAGQDPAADSAH